MNKRQNSQYNMLCLVQTHFDVEPDKWSSNVLISDAKAVFSDLIEQIETENTKQRHTSMGATMDKATLRKDLETRAFFVSTAMSAYTSLHPGENPEFARLDLSKSMISKLRENDLLAYVEELNAAASQIIESLGPYGVTEATLIGLMEARTAFLVIMNVPAEVTAERRNATVALDVLLRRAIALLKKTMDKLVELIRTAAPEFVQSYFRERRTHKPGTRTRSLEVTTLNAADSTPLAEAKIEVLDHGIKRISGKKGHNRIQNLIEGSYTLQVSHRNFVSQLIPFSVVKHQTTQIVVEMEEVAKSQSFKGSEVL